MPKPIPVPQEQTFRLDQFDPDPGDSYVTIREARQREQQEHDNLFAETSRVWNDADVGKVELKQRVSLGDIIRTEVELTLVDCNLIDPDTQGPLFRFGKLPNGKQYLAMTHSEFIEAWGKLPTEVANEIHSKVRIVNPQWGPEGKP